MTSAIDHSAKKKSAKKWNTKKLNEIGEQTAANLLSAMYYNTMWNTRCNLCFVYFEYCDIMEWRSNFKAVRLKREKKLNIVWNELIYRQKYWFETEQRNRFEWSANKVKLVEKAGDSRFIGAKIKIPENNW